MTRTAIPSTAMQTVFMKKVFYAFQWRIFLTLLCLLFTTLVQAHGNTGGGIVDTRASRLTGTAPDPANYTDALGINQSVTVDYNSYTPVQSTQVNKVIKNIISFRIRENTTQFITQDFTATILVQIDYGHSASTATNIIQQQLTVTYTKAEGAKYNAQNYFSFDNAEYVKVTILNTSYNIPVIGTLDTRTVLELENKIQITRYFQLANPVPAPASFNYTTPVDPVIDHLTATWGWPINTGNNATQLEWAWISDDAQASYQTNGNFNDALIFKYASRVDLALDKTQYDIPLLYEGSGRLFFRIRAVNFDDNGQRTDGPWVTSVNFIYGGHNNSLNWQATTSFAEEGKRKTVVQYYDGSLRPRQTVTKDNATNTVVTAETFYDAQGRAAIQILPTPGTSINTVMKYQANLNLFNGQVLNQDPAELFDLQPVANPNSFTPPLQTSTGTSQYYSAANTTDNPNIPDAEGYPYSVTRYTPDATGRVMMQSGVGLAHSMGNGHETKYFYGTPSQEELDGLFGTEVGNFTHYAKNMVMDANGQMSVSYVDMHGRTIATALAGATPTSLQTLDITNPANYPGQAGTAISRNLLDYGTNTIKGNTVESVNSLLVPAGGNYTFNYQLTPQALQTAACSGAIPANLCYDCLYDLEIAIVDEAGVQPTVIKKYSNVSVSPDDDCNTATPLLQDVSNSTPGSSFTFTQLLTPGSYSVRKTLSISESSLQYYKDLYMSKAMCKTQQQLIDSIYNAALSTSNCGNATPPTCQSCLAALGTEPDYKLNFLTSIGVNPSQTTPSLESEIHNSYLQAQQNCNKLCSGTSQNLPTLRQMMLNDMVPYSGQYAKADATENTVNGVHSMFDKYNIFSTANAGTQPFYKFPFNAAKAKNYYYDVQGNKDITIHPVADPTGYDMLNNTSPTDFEDLFKTSWANALLPHHPEYDRLVFAETYLTNSYNWINTFSQTDDFTTAQNSGYLNPVANDPYFVQNPNDIIAINNEFTSYYQSGLKIWQIVYGDVRCKSIANDALRTSCYTGAPNTPPPYAGFTPAENAQAWVVFRGLYMAARNRLVNKYIAGSRPLAVSTDETDLVAQNYRLWFPKDDQQTASQFQWTWWPTTQGGAPGNTGGGTASEYNGRCSSYIETWKARLLQCDALANSPQKDAILTAITTRMQAVCVNGSDASNPYGSSTVAPGTPASVTDRSFEDVIKNVFTQYGIINTSGIYTDNYCNPFVVEWPKPYGKNPKMYNGESTGTIDSCNCKQYAMIAGNATSAGVNITNLGQFNQYLFAQYGDTLTTAMYAALQHCSELQKINCTSNDTLIMYNCGTTPPACPTSRTNMKGNDNVVTNILNAGYNCSTLTADINNFHNRYGYPTGAKCQDMFVDYFNSVHGTSYTWADIANLYQRACGTALDVCGSTGISCTDFTDIIAQFHAIYGYPYGGECQLSFLSYFNSLYSTRYSWADLETMYANSCGGRLDVCSACYITCHRTICDTTYGVYILPQPTLLPAFLKCGYVNNPRCITCAGLSSLTAEFKTIFGPQPNTAPVFTAATPLTPQQAEYNANYARFINYRTGYQYTWAEYAQAAGNATPSCNLDNYSSNSSATQTVICADPRPLADTIGIPKESPCQHVYTMAVALGQQIYQARYEALAQQFEEAYRAKCLGVQNAEVFKVNYGTSEYHYTLYYYDMAGNLVKTVPPKGVRPDFSTTYTTQVETDRANGVNNLRPHEFITEYRYNGLNQVVQQKSPDGGTSSFWYDRLGRLVISQNAQQATDNNYSYTKYDPLGRIAEVGQKPQTTGSINQTISQDDIALSNWLNNTGGTKAQVTRTTYDIAAGNVNPVPLTQQNLRNRVSYTQLFDTDPGSDPFAHQNATYYTYDVQGNVDKLLQDYKGIAAMSSNGSGNRFKLMTYDYDLISGKVNQVSYQPGQTDAFYHKYSYDAENRLTEVKTSRDGLLWESDARYSYYRHGPLARTELGQLKVQGMDYSYTIHGWLKGVNNTALNPALDVSGDGTTPTSAAKDELSYNLYYYNQTMNGTTYTDYKPVGGTSPIAKLITPPTNGINGKWAPLYNGNIAAMAVNIAGLTKNTSTGNVSLPLVYNYGYDQLNRLTQMKVWKGLDVVANQWNCVAYSGYKESVIYDPNGNIVNYARFGDPARGSMDQLDYFYKTATNQLDNVYDYSTDKPGYNDIKQTQPDNTIGQHTGNYTYDAIGNLTGDVSEGITNISWTVYGKIKSVTKNGNNISYTYDVAGNRVSKTVGSTVTVYVRDASGNVMSVYQVAGMANLQQKENHLYGSSRIGMANQITVPAQNISGLATGYGTAILSTFTRGEKLFELSNHLGNVLETITDKKVQHSTDNTTVDYFTADVSSAQDYYPGGMQMPGRKYTQANSNYRYGFNGKENDNEVKGEGNQQDYGMRIYDPRLVKFLSVDPLAKKYPELTPYQFASNRPIDGIDEDGLEYSPAGRNGIYQLATDATAVQHYPLNPVIASTQIQEAPQRITQKARDAVAADVKAKSRRQVGQNSVGKAPEETEEHKEQSRILKANYEYFHPKQPEFLNNKYYQNFANNLAMPMITWVAGDGAFKIFGEAGGALFKGFSKSAGEGGWMSGSTVFGGDAVTKLNASRMIPEKGVYQVLLHGTPEGFIINGIPSTPKALAQSLLENGFQRGTPIRLISCNTGVFGDGAAYQVSRYLKSPIMAPTNKVRILENGAYEILGGGRFRTFFNTTIQ